MAEKVLSGGDKLTKKLAEISAGMHGDLSVGFMSGATYPNGTPVAAVAFWNEFGIPEHKQPPRPFFRGMIEKESPTWPKKVAAEAKATDYDGAKVLAVMGEDIKGALQQSIVEFTTPGLSPVTIKMREARYKSKAKPTEGLVDPQGQPVMGMSKPLVDTGVMLNSITAKVDD